MMSCALSIAQPAALAPCGGGGSRSVRINLPRLRSSVVSGRTWSRGVVAKAAQDSSETGSIVKYVKSSFNTTEDIFALAGIGFAAIAAFWASMMVIEAIDKLPVLPIFFEIIGISVAWWFIYGNLLFKPDREKFVSNIKSSVSQILGE
ncbi:protein CURVATURE THYLAKOID 1C, chloroplastic-like [Lolium rigidum]|uniref:protein CURVATURE THYLAKOID 1C, chloroplastic-like n=1 Tax=Lolium rigidum TaxID=89674 RepID=UPI001F5D5C52|nr:protein CURVATURE THYLAKOID 1C, chloroplastic-like [Lolium rigidum]